MWKTVLEDHNLTRPEDEPTFRQLYLNSTYQPDQVSNLKLIAVGRAFHHHQVVKKALVEERSKATKPLQPLAPLFPDLGEPSLNIDVPEFSCFDNFLLEFR